MRVLVVGGGIVGLATARALAQRGDALTVLEKEARIGAHQTGRNSGVIHSGLYYAPGSLKATLAVRGAASMTAYARAHGVLVETTGKLVVATSRAEIPGLHALAARAVANGVPARLLTAAEAAAYEPHVACVEALRVEATGIVDYPGVCRALAADLAGAGGVVRRSTALAGVTPTASGRPLRVRLQGGEVLETDVLVACAGLQADLVARACGLEPQARILPFRGEYMELVAQREHLVRGLVYPVPDPRFPFLGVHLTRTVLGGVHAGPNAVLALRREGYTWRDVDLGELRDALGWPGLWRLGRGNLVPGAREVVRSLSRAAFARSVARLVPGITAADLVPAPAGVRAQAVRRDGTLVDDFLVQTAPRQVHVLNAPSPAATASLEIAAHLVAQVDAAVG
ncbi:MAG: L-2-hydroxyglutarate oxidase [Lapillicoccus sp.]